MIIIVRIAENSIEILKQDHEKEVETLKEELKRLKEELISLQRQKEEGEQLNSELQEQIGQLTKHVKTIPDLHKDLANLQNQLKDRDWRVKQSSEQARGAGLMFTQACNLHYTVCVYSNTEKLKNVPCFSAVKINDITSQLLCGAVEEEVLLG